MGALAEALGVYGDVEAATEGQAAEDRLNRLTQGCEQFLRGGGSVSIQEFAGLSEIERSSLAVAGDRVATRQAVRFAHAARTELGEAAVLAVLDGGDSLVSRTLAAFMDRARG